MKKSILIATLVISLTLSLGACSSDNNSYSEYKQKVSNFFGKMTGGLVGTENTKNKKRQVVTGPLAVLGSLANGELARRLDKADLMYHQQAIEEAYSKPLNKTTHWENEATGHTGSVTPTREGYQASTGNLCRQYKQTITVDEKTETGVGTACQNYDGTWSIAQ